LTNRETYKTNYVFRDICLPKITLLENILLLFYPEKKAIEISGNRDRDRVFIYKKMRGKYYFLREEL